MARLRLRAGCCMLKLAQEHVYESCMNLEWFQALSLLIVVSTATDELTSLDNEQCTTVSFRLIIRVKELSLTLFRDVVDVLHFTFDIPL